MVSKKGLQRS